MTISPLPREKINIFVVKVNLGSNQTYFVVLDKGGGIVELLNIILSVPLGAIFFPANQILNGLTFFFFDLTLVKELFYLKALQLISIAFHKYKRQVWMKTVLQKSSRLGMGLAPTGPQRKLDEFVNQIEFYACRLGSILFP